MKIELILISIIYLFVNNAFCIQLPNSKDLSSEQGIYALFYQWFDCLHPERPGPVECIKSLRSKVVENKKNILTAGYDGLNSESPHKPLVGREFSEFVAYQMKDVMVGEKLSNKQITVEEVNNARSDLFAKLNDLKLGEVWKVRDTLFADEIVDLRKASDPKLALLAKEAIPDYFNDINPEIKLRMLRGVCGAIAIGNKDFDVLKEEFSREMAVIFAAMKFAGPFMQKFVQRLETMATETSREHLGKFTSSIPAMIKWERDLQLQKADFNQDLKDSITGGSIAEVYLLDSYENKPAVMKLKRWNIRKFLDYDVEFFGVAFKQFGQCDSVEETSPESQKKPNMWQRFRQFCRRFKKNSSDSNATGKQVKNAGEALLDEVKEGLYQEINFQEEYDNLELMNKAYKKYSKQFTMIQRVALKSKDDPVILIMTKAEGVPASSILNQKSRDSKVVEKLYKKLMTLLESYDEEAIFRSGYFHGDIHVGNIFYDESNDKLSLIDFGKIGKLEKKEQRLLTQLGVSMRMKGAVGKRMIRRIVKRASIDKSFKDWKQVDKIVDEIKGNSKNPANDVSNLIIKCREKGITLSQNMVLYGWSRSLLVQKLIDIQREMKETANIDLTPVMKASERVFRRKWYKVGYNVARIVA